MICFIGTPMYRNRHRRNRVKIVEPHQDGLLNFGFSSDVPTFQVLLQWSEKLKNVC
ncbi:hypothetical protein AVEN_167005-1, partial [Araneus ventricosus]